MTIRHLFNRAIKYAFDSDYRFLFNVEKGKYDSLSDEKFLRRIFKARMGYDLDLNNPQTFNEKIQYLKLHNRKPQYTMMVDKYEVRKYISELIGKEYLIPLLGVWNNTEEIDFDRLPNQFVLKCNHNSGLGMCICKDKKLIDVNKVKKELDRGLEQDYYMKRREWPYKNVKRKIVCEKYMEDKNGADELSDYKVLCFNGVPKLVEYHTGRFGSVHTQDYYDLEWNQTKITNIGMNVLDIPAEKPVCLDEMLELSSILAKDIPHVRVDWYVINGELYFGELTFFDGSGLDPFSSLEDDKLLGSWIDLNNI